MRRLVLVLLCAALLAVPVGAVGGVTSANNQTVVDSDGSCQVTLTMTLQLEGEVSGLEFPLPKSARDITVNGSGVRTTNSGNSRDVDLSDFVSVGGTYTLVLRYALSDAVTADARDNLTLTIPMLNGFSYPVDNLTFSVTLPGEAENMPEFSSTYYPETVDTLMDIQVEGAVISGSVAQQLPDHETLTLKLAVDEEMFPQSVAKRWSMDTVDLIMIAFVILAVLYWLASMGCKPPKRSRRTSVPEGITAGELGCRLTGRGVDFTMMVVSWAQMGYLLIQPDDNGRVLLHKRMEMGNERSEFENRCFRNLFGKRNMVDGTGYHYARLCRKAAKNVPGRQICFRRSSGNPLVFRVLAVAVGTFSGVSLAIAFARDTLWKTVLAVLLGILGTAVAWLIQGGGRNLHSRNRLALWSALTAAAVWILLSIPAGEGGIGVLVVLVEFLAGMASAYGGQRTEAGKQVMADILGLRRYLKSISTQDWKRILKNNPEYFYEMAPYALALGVDRAFIQRIGKARLPECPYLTTGMDGHLTVREWNQLLRDTVDSLDALQKRLPLEKILGR